MAKQSSPTCSPEKAKDLTRVLAIDLYELRMLSIFLSLSIPALNSTSNPTQIAPKELFEIAGVVISKTEDLNTDPGSMIDKLQKLLY